MKTFAIHSSFPHSKLVPLAKSLEQYQQYLKSVIKSATYDAHESSLLLPSDPLHLDEAASMARAKQTPNLRYVVVVGIGGSNLGTQAVYEALRGPNFLGERTSFPQLLFLDTLSTPLLENIEKIVLEAKSIREVLINIITKSGVTTETLANFEALMGVLKKRFAGIETRVVVTTDFGSPLWKAAQAEHLSVLPIPPRVGGRFSVLSDVGLFPLHLAGIDVKELLAGALAMRKQCLRTSLSKNPALISSATLFSHIRDGFGVHNTFFFQPHFEALGKWYRQLLGESIGKRYTLDGKESRTGMLPVVSIGSTDLHSLGQFYFEGPRNIFTTFVYAKSKKSLRIPKQRFLPTLLPDITGKNISDIMDALYNGVKEEYKKEKLPFLEITLSEVRAFSVGQFLQMKMMEIMYLAKLLNVNAFDQGGVEGYKKWTRQFLRSSHKEKRVRLRVHHDG